MEVTLSKSRQAAFERTVRALGEDQIRALCEPRRNFFVPKNRLVKRRVVPGVAMPVMAKATMPAVAKATMPAVAKATMPAVAITAPERARHKEDIFELLQKAVGDGRIDLKTVARFPINPEHTLTLIPVDVQRDYGIPTRLDKSDRHDTPLTRGETLVRLERAVAMGDLSPRALEQFSTNPNWALGQINKSVATKYGIPSELSAAPLRKGGDDTRALTSGEIYSRISDAIYAHELSPEYRILWHRWGRGILKNIPEGVREKRGLPSE